MTETVWGCVLLFLPLCFLYSSRIRGSSPSSCGSSPHNFTSTPPPDMSSPGGKKVRAPTCPSHPCEVSNVFSVCWWLILQDAMVIPECQFCLDSLTDTEQWNPRTSLSRADTGTRLRRLSILQQLQSKYAFFPALKCNLDYS